MKEQYSKKYIIEALQYWKKQLNNYDLKHNNTNIISKPKTFYTKSFVNEALAYWYDQLDKNNMLLEAIAFNEGRKFNSLYTDDSVKNDSEFTRFIETVIIDPSIAQNIWSANITDVINKYNSETFEPQSLVNPNGDDDGDDDVSSIDDETGVDSSSFMSASEREYLLGNASSFDDEDYDEDGNSTNIDYKIPNNFNSIEDWHNNVSDNMQNDITNTDINDIIQLIKNESQYNINNTYYYYEIPMSFITQQIKQYNKTIIDLNNNVDGGFYAKDRKYYFVFIMN